MATEPITDRWLLARFRRVYSRRAGFRSPVSGYAGLIADLRTGLARLDAAERAAIDDDVLPALLAPGPLATLLRAVARRWPAATARAFAALTPRAYRYLVGDSRRTAPSTVEIERCRFLAEGGVDLCREGCQAPTERIFAERFALPLRMTPDHARGSCRLEFGGSR